MKKGDKYTISGVYERNPITRRKTKKLLVFTLMNDYQSGSKEYTVLTRDLLNENKCECLDGDVKTLS